MVKVYYDPDADLSVLKGRVIAVIGYGSQGRAQAQNMRDSGLDVIVGLRPEGNSWEKAKADGFEVLPVGEAAKRGDIIHILIPDMQQPAVYQQYIKPALSEGKTLGFAHGFNIHFKQIVPPKAIDTIMVAPKAPGPKVRELFLNGFGTPALIAVHQNSSGRAKETALAMAKALGCTRAGVIETNFKDETESDLIGEQTVLCGGLVYLIENGFETLVEAGYPPELAYFEACNEAKLIMDLIYERGFTGMLKAVSDTAKYGTFTAGPKVIDKHVKATMKKIVKDVQSGRFAKRWIKEYQNGYPEFNRLFKQIQELEIERVGRTIRKMAGIEK
ncbi:ketol-acid reductoisomerase [Candidatus Bathyarchaeota archaeon]|nr:ketol-acid reductoisomerase [Candidatus Bathyarchaeota archaeon]